MIHFDFSTIAAMEATFAMRMLLVCLAVGVGVDASAVLSRSDRGFDQRLFARPLGCSRLALPSPHLAEARPSELTTSPLDLSAVSHVKLSFSELGKTQTLTRKKPLFLYRL